MITSLQNPAIKNIVKLSKSKERRDQQLFVIEGARELSLAIQSSYKIETVYVCREKFADTKYPNVLNSLHDNILFDISPAVFEKIAYRENSDGLVIIDQINSLDHKLYFLLSLSRKVSITSLKDFLGRAPIPICGCSSIGIKRKVGMLLTPNIRASSGSLSTSIL
jgi:hypothetical protein